MPFSNKSNNNKSQQSRQLNRFWNIPKSLQINSTEFIHGLIPFFGVNHLEKGLKSKPDKLFKSEKCTKACLKTG
jgi:hypothetical protein